MALIGLDIGTTGCKSTVFDVEGNVCSYAYKEYGIQNRGPGMFELDPDELWESVKYVLGMSVKKYTGEKITALSVSSFGESAVPVDKNGKVLHNSLLYTDTRGSLQCEQLVSRLGLQSIMEQTGVHAHPMYTINKIMWFKENMPDVYKSTWKFMLFEDFILFRLGHEAVIDYSLASRTMAFNVTKKTWAEHIIEAAGVDGEIFSRAAPSGTVVGTINWSIAEEIGLPYDTLLVTGGHDQVCAAVGGGIVEEGSAIDGIGTVECITPAFGRPIVNSKMMDNHFACVPHAKEGMYVTYAFNFTGGSLLKWYRDNFAAAEVQEAQKTGRVVKAMKLGFNAIMYDGSNLGYEENIKNTKEIVKIARAMGVSVEAELGHVTRPKSGGAEGEEDDSVIDDTSLYTEPEQAKEFVERTDVDALAVAFGTAHGVYLKTPRLDLERLGMISKKVDVPLVMHGGSGLSEEDFKGSIQKGISKINYYTGMAVNCAERLKEELFKADGKAFYHNLMMTAINTFYEDARKTIRLFGSNGKA